MLQEGVTHLGLPVHEGLVHLLLDGVTGDGVHLAREGGDGADRDERREAQEAEDENARHGDGVSEILLHPRFPRLT